VRAGDDGFTLTELVVALAVVAVLMSIGVVMYGRAVQLADDVDTQLDLVTASKVQALHHLEEGEFSTDHDVLRALEPNIGYSLDGHPLGTVVVAIEEGRENRDVCLFALSRSGTWHSLYHSTFAGNLYGTSEPVPCSPGNVASWSRDPW
jgi:prepilin-type N-terminal cleavage/methylation domain-containing protein